MGTLVCRIELDKKKGITVTVENEDDGITQTLVMNGTSIITTCKGEEETSTITQKQDSIAIKCKTFTLDAEEITCHSTKDTLHKSDKKFQVKSTEDMSFTTDAALQAKASKKASVSAESVEIKADNKTSVSASTTSVKGTQKVEVEGMQVSIAGTTKAEMKGLAVKVAADGALNLEGQMTTLKGSVTNVQGSLVKLG
jgi:hypothetical protein